MTKQSYLERFEAVMAHLRAGNCYQLNLTQRFSAHYRGDEWDAYLKLRDVNQTPFSAFLRFPKGVVLSLSPERFIRLQDGEAETRPIKGTRPRGSNAAADRMAQQALETSAKERAENVMIVDLLRNDFGRVAQPGSVSVPSLFAIESFTYVHHLVSTVRATLYPTLNAFDLLAACFPGGSITGAPKIRAMTLIDALEPDRRSVYCGAIGYISACGNMDTSIAIRTLLCTNGEVHVWGGGGLVVDSDGPSEYQETFDKLIKIMPVLAETLAPCS